MSIILFTIPGTKSYVAHGLFINRCDRTIKGHVSPYHDTKEYMELKQSLSKGRAEYYKDGVAHPIKTPEELKSYLTKVDAEKLYQRVESTARELLGEKASKAAMRECDTRGGEVEFGSNFAAVKKQYLHLVDTRCPFPELPPVDPIPTVQELFESGK